MELNASILKEIDGSRQEALDLLMAAKYIAKNKLTPKDGGMLLVANPCPKSNWLWVFLVSSWIPRLSSTPHPTKKT